MMASFRADIALAAARTRMLAEQLPEERRGAVLVAWDRALAAINAAPTVGAAEAVLTEYRDGVERRLR